MKCIYKHLKGFCTYIYPQHSLSVLSCFDTLRKLCSRSQQHQSREGSTFHWDTCWLTSECTEKPHKYAEQRGAAFQRAWTLILQRHHRHVNCDARIGYRPHMPWSNLLALFADNNSRILHLQKANVVCVCGWQPIHPAQNPFRSLADPLTFFFWTNNLWWLVSSYILYTIWFYKGKSGASIGSPLCATGLTQLLAFSLCPFRIITTVNLPSIKWVWQRARHGRELKGEIKSLP